MKKLHKQVVLTREWTFEALLLLLKEKSYEAITITDITKKAGIARQTFYRNYQSKDQVVALHLDGIFSKLKEFSQTKAEMTAKESYLETFSILAEHQEELLQLRLAGLDNLIMERLFLYNQDYMKALAQSEKLTRKNRFALSYQLGALLNIVSDWIFDDMLLSAEEMAELFDELNQAYESSPVYLPKMLVRLAESE